MRLTGPQGLVLITSGIECLNEFHQHAHAVDSDLRPIVGPSGTNIQRFFVNKTELIEHIAKQADISKAAAGRALEAVIGGVRSTLKKGGSVTLVGFGTFAVKHRAARSGRNPQTGATIQISASNVPGFKAGKALKDAVNS